MSEPLFLFSTNTLLAYRINESYYASKHYVWCNPYSSHKGPVNKFSVAMVPSSTPCRLFRDFESAITSNDKHAPAIQNNRVGLLKGAAAKRTNNVISDQQEDEIKQIVSTAPGSEFAPLLYVIPYEKVKGIAKPVAPNLKAHPFSSEYIIQELTSDLFDIISFD